jgi:hypothetical protein
MHGMAVWTLPNGCKEMRIFSEGQLIKKEPIS